MKDMKRMVSPFDGHNLTTITYMGKPAWLAYEVGAVLGYSDKGKRLTKKIANEWSREFQRGLDYLKVDGKNLKDLKELLGVRPDSGLTSAPSLVLLFESGVHLVVTKTDKEVGVRFRRFLVDEVLPQLARTGTYSRDGEYVPPRVTKKADPQVIPPLIQVRLAREARLLAKLDLERKKFDVAERKQRATRLEQFIEKMALRISEAAAINLYVSASEDALGMDLSMFKPDESELEEKGLWFSPTDIARQLGVTVQWVGRAITKLELRDVDKIDMCKARVGKGKGGNKDVILYSYSPTAAAELRAFAEAEVANKEDDGEIPD